MPAATMLFLVVDAIPHDLALELWSDGAMPGFDEPRPIVSVFPSLSHVAVPSLLRGVLDVHPEGYEARYHDATAREMAARAVRTTPRQTPRPIEVGSSSHSTRGSMAESVAAIIARLHSPRS